MINSQKNKKKILKGQKGSQNVAWKLSFHPVRMALHSSAMEFALSGVCNNSKSTNPFTRPNKMFVILSSKPENCKNAINFFSIFLSLCVYVSLSFCLPVLLSFRLHYFLSSCMSVCLSFN